MIQKKERVGDAVEDVDGLGEVLIDRFVDEDSNAAARFPERNVKRSRFLSRPKLNPIQVIHFACAKDFFDLVEEGEISVFFDQKREGLANDGSCLDSGKLLGSFVPIGEFFRSNRAFPANRHVNIDRKSTRLNSSHSQI